MAVERFGRFVVTGPLGVGTSARVVRARDDSVDDDVAVKILRESLAADPDVRERFIEEARLLRGCASPRVATVYDIGQTSSGCPYVVLSLADRGTLAEDLQRRGALRPHEVAALAAEVAAGVADVHRAGVVHGDVRPSNILLGSGPDGRRVLVADVSLARGPAGVGADVGPRHFAAPEQVGGDSDIDARADVFGLGALVVAMLSGSAEAPRRDVAHRLVRRDPLGMRLLEIAAKAMAPERDHRYTSAEQFRSAVERARHPRPGRHAQVTARRRGIRRGPRPGPSRLGTGPGRAPRVRLAATAAPVLLIVAAAVTTLGVLQVRGAPPDVPVGTVRYVEGDLSLSLPVALSGEIRRSAWMLPGKGMTLDGVAASSDLGAWSDPMSRRPGVFVAVDMDRETAAAVMAAGHPQCRSSERRQLTTGSMSGSVVHWTGCPGGSEFTEGTFRSSTSDDTVVYLHAANLDDAQVDVLVAGIAVDPVPTDVPAPDPAGPTAPPDRATPGPAPSGPAPTSPAPTSPPPSSPAPTRPAPSSPPPGPVPSSPAPDPAPSSSAPSPAPSSPAPSSPVSSPAPPSADPPSSAPSVPVPSSADETGASS